MREEAWRDEVAAAVSPHGWAVWAAWLAHDGLMCFADLVTVTSATTRRITLSRFAFPTPAERQAEILRQLRAEP
jgi:hypothetical protein